VGSATTSLRVFILKIMFNSNGEIKLHACITEEEKNGVEVSVGEALQQIKSGHILINKARVSPKVVFEDIKINKLPCVIWNLSGKYIYLDVDFKKNNKENNPELSLDEIGNFKKKLMHTGWVYACWVSLSNTGVGLLVYYDCQIISEAEWKTQYISVMEELHQLTGYLPDSSCINLNRKNVLSYDPELQINPNVQAFYGENVKVDKGVHSNTITKGNRTNIATKCTPLVPDNMKMFHKQSFIDVHFKELIDDAIFVDDKKGYAVFSTRFTKISLYTPKKKKFNSSRKVTLFYTLLARYFLNPNYSHSNLFDWLKNYNKVICEPPLPEKDVFDIWEYALARIKSPDFYIKGNRDCYVHFFSTCSLSLKEKQSVVRQSQVVRSKFAIKEAIQAILNEGLPLTKQLVAKYSGRKIRTVTKYWVDFLPVEMQNKINLHKSKHYNKFNYEKPETSNQSNFKLKTSEEEHEFEKEFHPDLNGEFIGDDLLDEYIGLMHLID